MVRNLDREDRFAFRGPAHQSDNQSHHLAFLLEGHVPPANFGCGAGGSGRPANASKSRANSMKDTCQCAHGIRLCAGGIFIHSNLACHRSTMGSRSGPHFHSLGSCPMNRTSGGIPRGRGS